MKRPSAVPASLPPGQMPPMPVQDHEILEGNPDARGVFTARSADGQATAGYWTCEVGKYEFVFDYDEFVYLIEGQVMVSECHEGGRRFTLNPGDSAHFPQGITTIWEVKRRMTKYFVARSPF